MAVAAKLPPDLVEASALARELGRDREDAERIYDRLRTWWTRRKVRPYKRGDGRILLSRAEVARVTEQQERIMPLDDVDSGGATGETGDTGAGEG